MVEEKVFRQMALSFPRVEESPHFDLASFRVKKRIFATLDEKNHRAMVKLSQVDQSAFCAFDEAVIFPVPGGWGKQGATYIDLKKVKRSTLKDALTTAYFTAAPEQQKVKKRKLL